MRSSSRPQRQGEGLKQRNVAVPSFVLLLVLYSHVSADTFGSGDNSFDIDFVSIGNPGNVASTIGSPRDSGAVDYVYRIGKYEISRDMVDKVNADGDLKITMHSMSNVTGGARPDMPAAGVAWNEAARFVNWLNDSVGSPHAYKFERQPGEERYRSARNILLWQEDDPGYDADNRYRNSQAEYFLPGLDEWFKAAFYDPNANDGAGGYWRYTTGSDTRPTRVESGTDPETVVHGFPVSQGPADITQAGGLSAYGVMAMGGNLFEWIETNLRRTTTSPTSGRVIRGSNWNWTTWNDLSISSPQHENNPTSGGAFGSAGFRVASRVRESGVTGDFDGDGVLGIDDLNNLTIAIQAASVDTVYDLDGSGVVELADRQHWVTDIKKTWIGDANLDGQFNSGDLTVVFQAGKYELDVDAGWADGDWTGDGRFGTDDLTAAFQDGGYEMGARAAVSAVPEPSCSALLAIGVIGMCRLRKRR